MEDGKSPGVLEEGLIALEYHVPNQIYKIRRECSVLAIEGGLVDSSLRNHLYEIHVALIRAIPMKPVIITQNKHDKNQVDQHHNPVLLLK